jgi:hypothetical protein
VKGYFYKGGCVLRKNRDIVEDWLRENDPEYKKNKLYFNNRKFRNVLNKEKPVGLLKDVFEVAEKSGSRRVVT